MWRRFKKLADEECFFLRLLLISPAILFLCAFVGMTIYHANK